MARGNGLEDLRTARGLADQALQAVRDGRYAEAMAISSVGTLHLGLAAVAIEVLAKLSTTPQGAASERSWQRWRDETGGDLR